MLGQVRVFKEQAVVVHACHGHRYWPSRVPLSGQKKSGKGVRGIRLYWQIQGSRAVRPESVAVGICE